jgi:two-component system, cell cycle sensor histidine kinase and response regulator CckA
VARQAGYVVVTVSHDITERRRIDAHLLQAQKMETVGHLAGGIAHDFNNMLSVIIGFIGSAQEQLAHDNPAQHDLKVAENAAWRAAKLTRQLLAFARKQVVEPQVLNLNMVIVELDHMLRRLIDENIDLISMPAADLGQIKADPGQIEQVITNLVVNARDAMPQGGRLTIETANTILDSTYIFQHVGVIPGDYAMLAISDTGIGMSEATQARIFEPFFTTKEIGKGTGLGLAICYGIIKQSGGHIWVYSEVGQGTTFKIYLPRAHDAADTLPGRAEHPVVPTGTETVLLVEDEPLVRELASKMLHEQGYTVLTAANGEEAWRVLQGATGATIALLITDVVMPQMGGKALAEQARRVYPSIKVLFVSGYATDSIAHHGRLNPGTHFLSKPFTRAAFARKIRAVLDAEVSSYGEDVG